jgi:CHAD domain-containing protein
LRVAGRRLIAILRLMEAIAPVRAAATRMRLQALLRRVGAARDLDVQIAELGELMHSDDGKCLAPLADTLSQRRARQQQRVVRMLDSLRTTQLLVTLQRLAADSKPQRNPRTIAAVADEVVNKRFRRLYAAAQQVGQAATADNCHTMRLHAKKLRYVAEPLQPLYGAPLRRFLRTLARLQTTLGRLNDAHHAVGSLQAQSRMRRLTPEAIFAMGRMAEQQQQCLNEALEELPKSWRRAGGRRWRRFRRRMRDTAAIARAAAAG